LKNTANIGTTQQTSQDNQFIRGATPFSDFLQISGENLRFKGQTLENCMKHTAGARDAAREWAFFRL
jgi:hypothetical protein